MGAKRVLLEDDDVEIVELIQQMEQLIKANNCVHIELCLYEAIILLACGNYENCERVILDALAFSKHIKCIIKQMNFTAYYLIKSHHG